MDSNVIWTPQAKQFEFMQRPEDEALYGGAAGGGKSDALVIEATRQVHIPHYKALILRKTYPQLTELIEKSLRYYPLAFPKARYNASEHTWYFPSGAKVVFGSMQHSKDKLNYQGKALGTTPAYLMNWEEEQKKNDIQADIILRMRTDSDFMSAVENLYKLDKDKLQSINQMLHTLFK